MKKKKEIHKDKIMTRAQILYLYCSQILIVEYF